MKIENKYKIGMITIVSIVYLIAIFSSKYYVADWFSTDDAFYYFKIAENITRGLGSTFDGISNTNGYHPLWMIILLPIFSLSKFGLFLPLRMIILAQLVLALSTMIVLFDYLREYVSIQISGLISIMWILLIPVFKVNTNGTESALNAFAITLFWVLFSRMINSDDKEKFNLKGIGLLGITAVIVVFSRLDNIYLITIFGIWLGIYYFIENNWSFSKKLLLGYTKIEFIYFLPTAFLLSLYLILNKLIIGSTMPLSGQIKKYWGGLPSTVYGSRVTGIGEFLAEIFSRDQSPWGLFFSPYYKLVDSFNVSYFFGTETTSLGLLIVTALAAFFGYVIGQNWKLAVKRINQWSVIPLFFGTLVHFSYYKIFGYLGQRSWYWVGGSFFIVLISAIVFESILVSLSNVNNDITKHLPKIIIFACSFLILWPHFVPSISRLTIRSLGTHPYLIKSSWLENNTESASIIGMTGAGSTSYFIKDRTIMNLDGLVNGKEYFDALENRFAKVYLQKNGVSYIFGNQYIMLQTDPYQENYLRLLEQSDVKGNFENKLTLWKLNYSDN